MLANPVKPDACRWPSRAALVCARPLEVLQRQHRNLRRMLALNPYGAVGGTSFAATNSLEGFANIGFEAWPVFERRVEDAFHDCSSDLCGYTAAFSIRPLTYAGRGSRRNSKALIEAPMPYCVLLISVRTMRAVQVAEIEPPGA